MDLLKILNLIYRRKKTTTVYSFMLCVQLVYPIENNNKWHLPIFYYLFLEDKDGALVPVPPPSLNPLNW